MSTRVGNSQPLLKAYQSQMNSIQFTRQLRFYAEAYHKLGFNITGIMDVGKGPYHKWKEFMSRPQTKKEALDHPWHKLKGIGAITGVNGNIGLDFDQCPLSNIPMFLEKLKLPENYEWVTVSGGGNGFHIWFRSSQLVKEGDKKVLVYHPRTPGLFKQIELRLNAHVVLPPSLHSSGGQYRFWSQNYLTNKPAMIN